MYSLLILEVFYTRSLSCSYNLYFHFIFTYGSSRFKHRLIHLKPHAGTMANLLRKLNRNWANESGIRHTTSHFHISETLPLIFSWQREKWGLRRVTCQALLSWSTQGTSLPFRYSRSLSPLHWHDSIFMSETL